MNGRRWTYVLLVLVGAAVSGCAQAGMFLAANLTQVELAEGNYRIAAIDVHGEAEAAYLLGLSFSTGMRTQTVALLRVEGTGLLYKEAMDALWADFEDQNGPVVGRSLALVNVRYDSDNLNLVLYTRAKLSIRADVVEFGADEDEDEHEHEHEY